MGSGRRPCVRRQAQVCRLSAAVSRVPCLHSRAYRLYTWVRSGRPVRPEALFPYADRDSALNMRGGVYSSCQAQELSDRTGLAQKQEHDILGGFPPPSCSPPWKDWGGYKPEHRAPKKHWQLPRQAGKVSEFTGF